MGCVMSRDLDKYWDELSTQEKEEYIKKHEMMTQKEWEEYAEELSEDMDRMWEARYQKCDLAYFDGEDLVTLKNVRVAKDDNIYKTLEKERFVFVLGDNQSLILNTSRIVYLDIKNYDIHWGLSECGEYVLR